MKTITRLFTLTVIALLAMTSCNTTTENDTVTEQLLPGFFAVVEDMPSGATAVYSDNSYRLGLNYTQMTADVTIAGVKLPDGTSYPSMVLKDMPWTIDKNGWKVVSAQRIVPEMNGVGNVPTIKNFELRLYERLLETNNGMMYAPGACVRYTINDIYNVLSSYSPQLLFGVTTTTDSEGSSFDNKAVEYVVSYNTDTRMLSLQMNGAKFAPAMRAMDIELRNIPVKVSNGALTFDVENVIPYIKDVPFTAFPMTNVKGSFDPASGLDFGFVCNPSTMEGTFTVSVKCNYSSVGEM